MKRLMRVNVQFFWLTEPRIRFHFDKSNHRLAKEDNLRSRSQYCKLGKVDLDDLKL